jgi:hypothetical protein
MQDAATQGREVTLACDACPESWIVFVPDGEDITYDQTICPDNRCSGEGEEC